MTLSVIIPVYNGAAHLRETLAGVFAQTVPADEIVVIDDGSTDASAAILAGLGDRLRVVRQPNAGIAATRNVGIAHATGDLIAFLDQDDIWPADRTRILVEALAADPEADLASGLVEILWQRDTPPASREAVQTMHRPTLLGSVCIRRRLIDRLGPFSTTVGYADDVDFALRWREIGARVAFVQAVTLIYRMHPGNTSIDSNVSKQVVLTALQHSLRRRRRGTS